MNHTLHTLTSLTYKRDYEFQMPTACNCWNSGRPNCAILGTINVAEFIMDRRSSLTSCKLFANYQQTKAKKKNSIQVSSEQSYTR